MKTPTQAPAGGFAAYFIDRPIVAAVLSIVLVIAGALALFKLPLAEYPDVTPPTVVVRAAYPGANPKVIADTVAAPIEQEINGVQGMQYMGSRATSDGRLAITITFAQGVDPQIAQLEVQNRVSRALPKLPPEVQRQGVTTRKTSPDMLLVAHLTSKDERFDALYLSNFATLQVKDELLRLPGVAEVNLFGTGDYSLRVWLDPEKMAARALAVDDVVAALREQNVQAAAGLVGAQPNASAAFQLPVNVRGRLSSPEEFAAIVVKTGASGEIVRLADVARVEMGASQYALRSLIDNRNAVAIQVIQSPEASALEVAASVRAKLAQLQADFPPGIEHRIAYDPTLFVRASIDGVVKTIFEALALVVLVVILFLQSWRASLVPLAAVPVSIVGTFAALHLLGYSLNTLTLFGLVLSIGIVVDDAIVVVENVERHLRSGLSPREAARLAMAEVTRPIVAITAVLVAVFLPAAFLDGLSGQFYRQFAVTIAISTVISALNSLTLSPALAALLLKPHGAAPDRLETALDRVLGPVYRPFNRFFERSSERYVGGISRLLRRTGLVAALFGGLLALTIAAFHKVPAGFVPAQDKYYLVGIVQLPSGSSLDRTEAVVRRMTDIALAEPGVESVVAFPGLSVNGFVNLPNSAVMFAMLKPFDERGKQGLSAGAIAGSLNGKFSSIRDGFVGIFPPPPVPGLGAIGGFKLQIEDRAGRGPEALAQATGEFLAAARKDARLAGVFTGFQNDVPQVFVDVDRERAKWLGIELGQVFSTLQVYLGSLYVNDFNLLGRTYAVNVQGDGAFRGDVEAIGRLQVRNARGEMVPVAALASARLVSGPDPVTRYNGYASAEVSGGPAPGVSTGQAIAAVEEIAKASLPRGFAIEWTELTYQQKREGKATLLVFPLALLFAYLILAVQFNGFRLPLAVMLVVPTVLLSALAGVWIAGGDNNLFTQIGLVVLVGLAAKNAILIVEFALGRESEGKDPVAAVLDAARLRLRPILMTSAAFVMGVLPLVLASGAGAEMRRAMGVAVFSGMLGVTLFGLALTPVFYVILRRARAQRASAASPEVSDVRP